MSTSTTAGGGGDYIRTTTNLVSRKANIQGPQRVEMRGRVSKEVRTATSGRKRAGSAMLNIREKAMGEMF